MSDAPFQFFTVEVLRTERVTPSMARVVLGGPDMITRTYTVRELRRDPHELVIDFALHGTESVGEDEGSGGSCGGRAMDAASGPATRWARAARPGARIAGESATVKAVRRSKGRTPPSRRRNAASTVGQSRSAATGAGGPPRTI
ncbi:siderophore-interacting protein [Streptomyces sp. NPDC102274]|uniref:siderophore-interacting protein n=1 Tax=Streptomyces sp. NPDC102274 TaxID=3366151 RepID=UPI0037FA7940